jgi:hypothetical protein
MHDTAHTMSRGALRLYGTPALLEYGRLEQLTRGTGGTLPDFLGSTLVNDACPTQTIVVDGQTFSRTSCQVVPPSVGS